MSKKLIHAITLAVIFTFAGPYPAPAENKLPPLSQVIRATPGPVSDSGPIKLPLISWGGDIATILANGNSALTQKGSIFAQKGLSFKLERVDDFKQQVEAYLKGETPFLRGTMGMINMAAETLNRSPETKPVVIYQLTWSTGGDCLVVKPGIKTVKDLKGKTIAIQSYGPHVAYLAKILSDAGLTMGDVQLKWVKDLTGTNAAPAEAFYGQDVQAAFVIIPDGLTLTSGGATGSGAEGSVKGARILMSTKTANRIISDVYVVRSDYFKSNRDKVEKFVHGLMLARQELRKLFADKQNRMDQYKAMISGAAKILMDSDQAVGDTEALYADCQYVGFSGNVQFFGHPEQPRSFENLTGEIQSSLIALGLLSAKQPLEQAQWDYNLMRAGLTGVDDVEAPRFKSQEVAKVVTKKQAQGTLEEGVLFSFEINFQPNQKDFPSDLYQDSFKKVVEMAATYGGAVITVEGHSDPHKYNKMEKDGSPEAVLRRVKQAGKNLSMSRAIAVRDSVLKFAEANGLPLDKSQFTVIGHGIDQPKYPVPENKTQWLANMRVVFRVIQVEAEDNVFEPLK